MSSKLLYRVTLEYELMVMAEDDHEADLEAASGMHDLSFTSEPTFSIPKLITDERDIPEEWKDCIPYGRAAEDRTCLKILSDLKADGHIQPYDDPNQLKFPGFPEKA